jgi:hypothetical protein
MSEHKSLIFPWWMGSRRPPPAAVRWKPIETAPKDEVVMLYKPDEPRSGGYVVSGYWGEWPALSTTTECWIACSGGPLRAPTHWMPLPEPPDTGGQ